MAQECTNNQKSVSTHHQALPLTKSCGSKKSTVEEVVGNTKSHFTKSEVQSAGKTMIQKATDSACEWVFHLTRQLLAANTQE